MIPMQLWMAAAAALFTLIMSFLSYDYGYKRAQSQQIAGYQKEIRQLEQKANQALQRERQAYAKQEQLETEFLQQKQEIENHANATIEQYRNHTVRLRRSLQPQQCPPMPATADTAGSSDATTTGGLQPKDVEFLIREANRADSVVKQLAAAQKIIEQDRQICNDTQK